MTSTDTQRTIDAVWRIESPKIVAALARIVRDVGLAEDLAHDALVAALEQWPASGIPRNAGAWLMAAAKNRAVDYFRRNKMLDRKHAELGYELEQQQNAAMPDIEASLDDDVGDDLLRLIFTACHPILSAEARAALTLRLLGGLTTDEIARAFLVPEPTIAQRIVRAKRTLAKASVPFEVPRGDDRDARLSSVLEVIYLIFNEGYSATAGDDWMRPGLCEDALRLGRVLAGLAPDEAEVHGLVALMEIQASRSRARLGPGGEPVLLLEQDRGKWDQLLIRRGLAALERAERLSPERGPVHAAGGHRRMPRTSGIGIRYRLGAHRRNLRRPPPDYVVAGRRIESRGRCGHGIRSGSGAGDRGWADGRAVAQELSPPAERAWRFTRKAGAIGGSPRGVHPRGVADAKRARAGDAAGACGVRARRLTVRL